MKTLRWEYIGIVAVSLLIVVVLAAAILSHQRRMEKIRSTEARTNYAEAVRGHFCGHELWRTNEVIRSALRSGGLSGERSGPDRWFDLLFTEENDQIRREVVTTIPRIYAALNVFATPKITVVSDGESRLTSPEGNVRLKATWLSDPARVREGVRILRVEEYMAFSPLAPPTEKHDLRRLVWVTWSRPLPSL